MKIRAWQQMRLIERVRWLRFVLPPTLILVVVFYQLGIAQTLETFYGHTVHYGVEVAFYSLTGPLITWLMLVWVEHKLGEQEKLEHQVQAAEQAKASLLEEERARIARDLHDGLAQTLYFLALKTDMMRQKLTDNNDLVGELRAIGITLRQTIQDVRRTIFSLRSLDWSKQGFVQALESLIFGFAEQMDWQASVSMDENVAIPSRLEAAIFGVVQESLNNVAKHAEATHVNVALETEDGRLSLLVTDNGNGVLQTGGSTGMGINQMRERVTAVGGSFQIKSEPDKGTSIHCYFPLNGTTYG